MKLLPLPPPLAPWAALLEIFPTDLARALGPLVQRLDVAIGPLRARYRMGGIVSEGRTDYSATAGSTTKVANRHLGTFNALYDDGHVKAKQFRYSKNTDWTVQKD
jgi:prepilin-type processing-associated H-X9-DG protein